MWADGRTKRVVPGTQGCHAKVRKDQKASHKIDVPPGFAHNGLKSKYALRRHGNQRASCCDLLGDLCQARHNRVAY